MPGVDALYDAAAEDFVAARDALAKSLRAAGERDAAVLVKQLRRPTRAAWALNQLARRHADEVRSLVELGRALADAQEQALAGRDVDLRQAGRARMDVLRHLTRLAEGILGPGAAAQRDEVVATLTAASADPAAGAELVAGRLAEPLGAPAGFGDPLAGWGLAGSTTTPAPGRSARTRPAPKGSTSPDDPGAAPAPDGPGGTRRKRSTDATPPPADRAASRAASGAAGRAASRSTGSTGALPPPADLGAARAARAEEARRQADAARAEARAQEAAERADAARAAVGRAAEALATSAAAADAAADRVGALEAELDAARAQAAAARAAVEADTSALDAARREAADADRVARQAADAVTGHAGDSPR